MLPWVWLLCAPSWFLRIPITSSKLGNKVRTCIRYKSMAPRWAALPLGFGPTWEGVTCIAIRAFESAWHGGGFTVGDVTESLPQLIAERQAALQVTSLTQLYRRLPPGDDRITYETLRNLRNGTQRGVRDQRTLRDLALMLDVPEDRVRRALGVGPSWGPFELPPRASGLDPTERDVVLSVVDALLRAKRGEGRPGDAPADRSRPAEQSDYGLAARSGMGPPGALPDNDPETDSEGPEFGA